MILRLSFSSLRKWIPLESDAWKIICQFLIILLLSSFLEKSYNILERKQGIRLNFFVSLSTSIWWDYFVSLKHSQNLIVFNVFISKKVLRFFTIAMDCTWYRYMDEFNTHWVEWIELVIMIILETFGIRTT